ncbi:hypothetical protein SARC_15853 [Sphaeroforma arctica JP610]|uniref:Uncharacterized protein n=1 Tax=Sphaeroforma arctica JP610 TaxID=667725 RepID=A0A0L0F632_9EUKA|nr:hypothetical protein SARC_15853 [Sphaeroforma arctica JP610]KNC71608.1 hypothetical protein SARC_15853 [Sphaeroforma arctica JP610]|eukprot:XP_014145510.1 hypothetical protein SARC_15853 [Sphaeroforma arctica JP610]
MSEGNLLNVRNRGSSVSSSDGGSRVSGKGVRLRLTISSWATTEHELHNNSPTEKERFLEEILTDLVNERDPQDGMYVMGICQ